MAATGTPTPNIGLRIPLGTDPASVDDINYNSNILDTKLGAVGSDSVQDQIDTLNSNLEWKNAGSATAINQDVSFPASAKELYVEVGIQSSLGYAYSFYIVLTGSRYYFNGYNSSATDNGGVAVQVTSQHAIRVVTLQYKGSTQTTLEMNVKYR